MTSHTPTRAGSWTRGRLAQAGVGLGVAASVLASAAVATAAPTASAAHAPATAQPSVVHVAAHAQINPYSSVTVSARTVHAGQRITISGNAPRNARTGKWITLMSDAFATKHTLNGIPAIRAQVLVNGKYSTTAIVRAGLKPTNYAVMGTFQGKGLDTVAWVNVRRAAARPYSSVTVSARTVHAGQRITISGNAPRNARAGQWITLMSDAFAAKQGTNGVPAIRTQLLVNGKYSATATIAKGLQRTNYSVMGTFQGKGLDTVAWMTVR
jgi:hypothetical protein